MRQLGPYQLLRKIGTGGMAEVWAARMRGTNGGDDRFVAVKLLASHLAERREYRDMFLAEARLSMQLSHPNIVRVFDAVAHEADCYMVMELITGMTLSQLERGVARARETLPLVVSAYVVGELLRALAYAHQVRTNEGSVVVHRDVSPQNVMVTTDGQVKLMDFGIARFASQETQGAFVKGKLQYMPPEQLRKQTRKPTVDLYAVGAIFHELIDGQRFRAKLDHATLMQTVLRGDIPPLGVPVPSEVDIVRTGLLEPDEAKRIQSARNALGILSRWSGYREATAELRGVVERFLEGGAVVSPADLSKISSVPEGSLSGFVLDGTHSLGTHSLELRSIYSDPQIPTPTSTQTVPTGVELTGEDLEPQPVLRRSPAQGRPGLVPALIGVGLAGVLGVGVIFALADPPADPGAERGDPGSDTSTPNSEATVAAAPKPVPTPAVTPPTALPVEPSELPVEPSGTPIEPNQPLVEPSQPLVEPPSQPPVAPPVEQPLTQAPRVQVPVEFVANEFFFVYVKVGGKVLTLEPRSRLDLPEGKHTVYLRESPDDAWTRAGRIELEPGNEYRVEMGKPADLELVKK